MKANRGFFRTLNALLVASASFVFISAATAATATPPVKTYQVTGTLELADGVHPVSFKIKDHSVGHITFGAYFIDLGVSADGKNSVHLKFKILKQEGKQIVEVSSPQVVTRLDQMTELSQNTKEKKLLFKLKVRTHRL